EPKQTSILSEGISLSKVIHNTLPDLIYLELCNKSDLNTESTEKRFPDEIANWTGFEQEGTVGQPDFVIVNSDMILLVVWECKTKWVLNIPPNKDIVSLY
ncbi:7195_t:CDS:2, partial [Entrophospora sp. SA101]